MFGCVSREFRVSHRMQTTYFGVRRAGSLINASPSDGSWSNPMKQDGDNTSLAPRSVILRPRNAKALFAFAFFVS